MRQVLASLDFDLELLIAKAGGALAGSAISLAYVLPKTKRQAAIRLLTGVMGGMVFGLPVGVWIADRVHIEHGLGQAEIALMGAGVASLSIWTLLGIGLSLSRKYIEDDAQNSAATKQDDADE